MVGRVVNETEIYNGRKHGGIHTRAFAIVVVAQHITMFPTLSDGESSPKCGLKYRRANLAHATTYTLDSTPSNDDEPFLISVIFCHSTQIPIERKLFARGNDDTIKIGGRASNVMFAGIGRAIEPGCSLGNQFGNA